MIVNKGMVPPGGWHYPEGPGQTIRADTYELLIDAIFQLRLRAGKPEGNIKRDIDNYFCSRWPGSCVREAVDYGYANTPNSDRRETIDRSVARFAARMVAGMPQGGYELTAQFIANDRAKSCVGCPRNVPWKTGCGSCSAATSKALLEIRKMRNTPEDQKLMACDVFGCENSTAVHLPDSVVKPTDEQKAVLPQNCWRLKVT